MKPSQRLARVKFGVFSCLVIGLMSQASIVTAEADISFDSIVGTNQLEYIENALGTPEYELARSVARMEAGGGGYCSAFRIGETLIMTNYHCMVFKPCDQVSFHFAYERGLLASDSVQFKCSAVLSSLEHLDYALYRVEQVPTRSTYEVPILALSDNSVAAGARLLFPSHAATMPKQIDRSTDCIVAQATPYEGELRRSVGHNCDSMSGSSGSPLIRYDSTPGAKGVVVGLHWGGRGDHLSLPYNQAIQAVDILEHLRSTVPEVVGELRIDRED